MEKETREAIKQIFEREDGKPIVVWDVKEGSEEVYKTLIKELKDGEE